MGGYETGISSIVAPVFDNRGKIAAAISISVPAPNIDAKVLPPLVEIVREAADQLTRRIKDLPPRT